LGRVIALNGKVGGKGGLVGGAADFWRNFRAGNYRQFIFLRKARSDRKLLKS
jgi:hypothetical protein